MDSGVLGGEDGVHRVVLSTPCNGFEKHLDIIIAVDDEWTFNSM